MWTRLYLQFEGQPATLFYLGESHLPPLALSRKGKKGLSWWVWYVVERSGTCPASWFDVSSGQVQEVATMGTVMVGDDPDKQDHLWVVVASVHSGLRHGMEQFI